MRKKLLPLLLCLCLLPLAACGGEKEEGEALSIVASTHPLYLLTEAVSATSEGISVSLLISQELGCLHDYTLTVNEMKLLESADVLIVNGAGLDDFVLDAVAGLPEEARPEVIDCSQFVDLLPLAGGDGETPDPHYWMDPILAARVVQGLSIKLSVINPQNTGTYRLDAGDTMARLMETQDRLVTELDELQYRELITFHDGFAYFANAFELNLVMAVEEEEGQEASAKTIAEALDLIEQYRLPAIFTEKHSADATAQAIGREAEVSVVPLTMLMSPEPEDEETGVNAYLLGIARNIFAIIEALE